MVSKSAYLRYQDVNINPQEFIHGEFSNTMEHSGQEIIFEVNLGT